MIAFSQPKRIEQNILDQQLSENAPLINQFCKRYNVKLVAVTTTYERDVLESAYEFTDGQGRYTIDGIKRSLRDEE